MTLSTSKEVRILLHMIRKPNLPQETKHRASAFYYPAPILDVKIILAYISY